MSIDLKPEQQRVIDLAIQSGAYRNPAEVLDACKPSVDGRDHGCVEQAARLAGHGGSIQGECGKVLAEVHHEPGIAMVRND